MSFNSVSDFFGGKKCHFLQNIYMIFSSSTDIDKAFILIKISVFPFSFFISTHQTCLLPNVTSQLFHLLLKT